MCGNQNELDFEDRYQWLKAEMKEAGLPSSFVTKAFEVANDLNAVTGLLQLWPRAHKDEQDEIVADIQDVLDELEAPEGKQEKPFLTFDEWDRAAEEIVTFKKNLLEEIQNEGVTLDELAEKAEVPVSYLTRFFDTAAMPKRVTLSRITDALDFPVTTTTKWAY